LFPAQALDLALPQEMVDGVSLFKVLRPACLHLQNACC
jgi:hypothetical protein